MSLESTAVHDFFFFFFSSRRRHTRFDCDWSSDVCSSDLAVRHHPKCVAGGGGGGGPGMMSNGTLVSTGAALPNAAVRVRSEERRVGKEGRSRWSPDH